MLATFAETDFPMPPPMRSPFAPNLLEIDIRDGLPSLTIRRNGQGLSDRQTGHVVDLLKARGVLPSRRVSVSLHDRHEPNAATLADWIGHAITTMEEH